MTHRDREADRQILVEMDRNRRACCLATGAGEGLGVGIESNDLDLRMNTLNLRGQRAGAAANVKNPVTRTKRRLIELLLSGRFTAEQLYDRIIERQKPVVTGRRKISA